jgi:hypothetical protein
VSPTSGSSGTPGAFTVVLIVAAVFASLGIAAAVGTQITPGPTETGQGAYVTEHALPYWVWHETALTTIPPFVPGRVSTTVTAPSVLPRGAASYTINAGVAGQTAIAWTFDETAGAPRLTEIAITFLDGLTPPATSVTIYVETNFAAPPGTVAYVFYWDAGTFTPGGLDIETMTATALACPAIGTCP